MERPGNKILQGKLVLLGDMGTGKTSVVLRFVKATTNMVMVANKSGLESSREVKTEDGERFSEENRMFFMETSAKTAQNINELFYEIGKCWYRKAPIPLPHA